MSGVRPALNGGDDQDPAERPVREDRHEDRGREARGSSRTMRSSIRENPEISMAATALVTALLTIGGGAIRGAPANASSGQIEIMGAELKAVAGKFDALAGKFDTLAGDVRSLRESDVVGRMRRVEEFVSKQEEYNREAQERRHDWNDWRKLIDAKVAGQK